MSDAKGLRFECRPDCGFCCTASPLVAPGEASALGPLVVTAQDGTLRIPVKGAACSALQADKTCGVYGKRPLVCHFYPYQVHAGRRIQVSVTLACPGIEAGEGAEADAEGVASLALAQPGGAQMAAQAKATFVEFDRRMKEWNVAAPPDKLRAAFLPHVATLAQPGALPALFANLAEGTLSLEGNAARAVGDLFLSGAEEGAEEEADIEDLLLQAAEDGFDEPGTVIWVEPDLSWTSARARGERVHLTREKDGARRVADLDVAGIPTEWTPDAALVLERYLARLLARDHTEGAAAWLVDASGYQATPAAAYARVMGEASLQVLLRAGLLAAESGLDAVDAAHARRGVSAYETSFHSLPTLGAIL